MPSSTPTLDFIAHWLLFGALCYGAFVFVRRARRSQTRAKLVLGNALVFLALLGGVFAAGETYLRYVYDQTNWHAEALTTRAWLKRHCRLNRTGFRDVDFARAQPPGTTRIVFMGDSFTFGYGVADPADLFVSRVRADLTQRFPGKYEIWNAGQIGANTSHELQTLRAMFVNASFDRVVLSYCPNDIEDLLPRKLHHVAPFAAAEPGSLRSRSYLLDHLYVRAALLDTSISERFFAETDAFHRDPARFAEQAERIALFARLCRETHVQLDVVVWPLISHWGPDYPYAAWHDRIEAAWRAAGIEPIDLRKTFAGLTSEDLRANALDAHPNERAHALVAEELLRRLFSN